MFFCLLCCIGSHYNCSVDAYFLNIYPNYITIKEINTYIKYRQACKSYAIADGCKSDIKNIHTDQ